MDDTAVVPCLMRTKPILSLQHDRRTAPLRHGKSGGETNYSAPNDDRAL
jgi:hypothetical protein